MPVLGAKGPYATKTLRELLEADSESLVRRPFRHPRHILETSDCLRQGPKGQNPEPYDHWLRARVPRIIRRSIMLREFLRRIPKEPLIALPGVRRLWRRFPIGSVHVRTKYDIWERPAYAHGVFSAARLAKQPGISRIAALEFGVARGDGLVALEHICAEVGTALDMSIGVFGFDSGRGQPKPIDYRDMPASGTRATTPWASARYGPAWNTPR